MAGRISKRFLCLNRLLCLLNQVVYCKQSLQWKMQGYETCNDKWHVGICTGNLFMSAIWPLTFWPHYPKTPSSCQRSGLLRLRSWLACIDPLFGNKVPTQLCSPHLSLSLKPLTLALSPSQLLHHFQFF